MKTINVINAFSLILPGGERQAFSVGKYEVDDDIANHWYTKAHTEDPVTTKVSRVGKPTGDAPKSDQPTS